MGQHGKHRALVSALALACAPVPATAETCRLALLLALDVSNSVNTREDRQQREGLAAALVAPPVRDAFLLPDAPVALAAYEWSGRFDQFMVLDWTLIETGADLEGAAARIAASQRPVNTQSTALGAAIGYGAGLFARAPRCDAQTLDISGDGKNNDGFGPAQAYRSFPLGGVTVNALIIGGATGDDLDLADYFRDHVVQGLASFVETTRSYADYEEAMTRKLLRELQGMALASRQ